ncbi:MAG: hypothetical protein MUF10_03025 [Thermoanaerobaculaceae bacterium]|jgi:hypothetical protein|nr:hypothetical protein [Thermoanaerobaculaceae bacterium]
MRSPTLDPSQTPPSSGPPLIIPGHPVPVLSPSGPRTAPSPWRKVLVGCAIGCGVVGLAVAAFLIWGAWWVVAPGSQVSTEVVLVPEAVAVVHFAGDERARGLVELLGTLVTESGRRQNARTFSKLPESWRWLERLGAGQDQRAAGGMGAWVPSEATLVVVTGQDERRHVVLAANFKGFVRPLRALVTSSARREGKASTVTTHAGREVTVFSDSSSLSFVGGTLLWSDDTRLVEAALDRADDGPPARSPSFLPEDRYAGLKEGRVLVAAATNRTGLLTTLGTFASVRGPSDSPAAGKVTAELPAGAADSPENPLVPLVEGLDQATLAVTVPTRDRAEIELVLVPADPAALQPWRALLTERLEAVRLAAAAHEVQLDHDLRVEGDRVVAAVRMSGLTNLAREWAEVTAREDESSNPGIGESDSTPPPAEAPDGHPPAPPLP